MNQPSDWTRGPAKWVIAITLATLGVVGLAWSIVNHPPTVAPTQIVGSVRDASPAEPEASLATVPTPPPSEAAPVPPDAIEPSNDARGLPGAFLTRINVNSASAAELQLLPRIGPVLAARLIESRERDGPFRSASDLERVRGIGPATRAGLEPLVTFGTDGAP